MKTSRTTLFIAMTAMLLALAACSNGSSSNGSCPSLTGTWAFTEHCDSDTANDPPQITQNGCNFTVTGTGYNFSGTIKSDGSLSMNGTISSGDSMQCTGKLNGDTISETCGPPGETASCQAKIKRTGGTNQNCPNVAGTWKITQHCESDAIGDTSTVTQNGCSFSVTGDGYQFSGTINSDGSFTVNGTITGGDSMQCSGTATQTTITENCTQPGGSGVCAVTLVRQ